MTSQTRRSENLGPITAVLFDLDDTLIDTARALERLDRYWYRTLPKGRRPASEDGFVDAMFEDAPLPGVGLAGIYGRMLEIWPGCFPDISSAVDAHNKMMPGMIALELSVESMLVDLRAWQVPVGVVTNGFTQTQWSKIRSAGIDRLVKGVVVSEEFGAWKPDPRIFLLRAGGDRSQRFGDPVRRRQSGRGHRWRVRCWNAHRLAASRTDLGDRIIFTGPHPRRC